MYTHLFDHLAMINTLKCHGSNRWDKDLRACCMCGLLKNERMWLEFGCENCPFLIDPGASNENTFNLKKSGNEGHCTNF